MAWQYLLYPAHIGLQMSDNNMQHLPRLARICFRMCSSCKRHRSMYVGSAMACTHGHGSTYMETDVGQWHATFTKTCMNEREMCASGMGCRPTKYTIIQGMHTLIVLCAHRLSDFSRGLITSARQHRLWPVYIGDLQAATPKANMHKSWHCASTRRHRLWHACRSQETSTNYIHHLLWDKCISHGVCASTGRHWSSPEHNGQLISDAALACTQW